MRYISAEHGFIVFNLFINPLLLLFKVLVLIWHCIHFLIDSIKVNLESAMFKFVTILEFTDMIFILAKLTFKVFYSLCVIFKLILELDILLFNSSHLVLLNEVLLFQFFELDNYLLCIRPLFFKFFKPAFNYLLRAC